MRAVRFDRYGDVDVLDVRGVDDPPSQPGRVVVRVRATGLNPGEVGIREGAVHHLWPATFPSGEGSDLAGVVESVGAGVTEWSVGDEVLGWSDERAAQAELVSVPTDQLVGKPAAAGWDVAGGLYVAGVTAWAAVEAVRVRAEDTVVVSGAAGGVGGLAVQLATRLGARVIGLASESNHEWLASLGALPVAYGDGQQARIRSAAGGTPVDAFIDTFGRGYPARTGPGYLDLALGLGVAPDRVDTVVDFDGAAERGVKAEGMSSVCDQRSVLAELADLVAKGELDLPISAAFPLDEVRAAYRRLQRRSGRGKIVLRP